MAKLSKLYPPGDEKKKPASKKIANLAEYTSRKQAFDDSTTTYQNSIKNHNKLISAGLTKTKSISATKDEQDEMLINGGQMNNFTHSYTDPKTGQTIKKSVKMYQKTTNKIAPVKSNTYTGKPSIDEDGVSYQQEITLPIYKAPSQVVEYTPDLNPIKEDVKKEVVIGKRTSGGDIKKVISQNKKYANQREYSTYEKSDGKLVEDKFKQEIINRRKAILEKNSIKKDNKK